MSMGIASSSVATCLAGLERRKQADGDIAILYYRINAGNIASRMTHTWIRRETGSFILGGMDSTEPAESI